MVNIRATANGVLSHWLKLNYLRKWLTSERPQMECALVLSYSRDLNMLLIDYIQPSFK